MTHKLYGWREIRKDFKQTLVLGNGASIAVDKWFSYTSLYDEASEALLLNEQVQRLFKHYSTTDFEFVLRLVWRAHQINKLFGVEDKEVAAAYIDIRESLIKVVQRVHVSYSRAVEHLPSIAGFLHRFKTIVSLNYDLLVYWAMLYGNNILGGTWFKDCFINADRSFKDDYRFLSKPHGSMTGATLVFYPHGNLVLATNFLGQETKICSDQQADLLENIVRRWKIEDSTPLFVSEGSSDQKLGAIHRNGYLRTIYNDVLGRLPEKQAICVYGWSMSLHDHHLIEVIGKSKPAKLAISVFTGSSDWEKSCGQLQRRLDQTLGFKHCEVFFYDSQSDECWVKNRPFEKALR